MNIRHVLEEIEFEWDSRKAASNLKKHGVSFEYACEVFFDPFLYAIEEKDAQSEAREAVIGMTIGWELLHVAFTDRNNAIRIISARPVTRQERLQYENQ